VSYSSPAAGSNTGTTAFFTGQVASPKVVTPPQKFPHKLVSFCSTYGDFRCSSKLKGTFQLLVAIHNSLPQKSKPASEEHMCYLGGIMGQYTNTVHI
jgi:hypothetical protein